MPGLRGLLNEVDWLWPESVHLRISLNADRLQSPVTRPLLPKLTAIYKLAATAVQQPEPDEIRLLSFDLFRPMPDNPVELTVKGLFDILRGEDGTAFDVFKRLRDWQATGLLADVQMTVRRRNLDDVLFYDWLSDGERMFLGRMALFHLMAGEDDALIILDEPETHFNDVWKREIVDIIDDSLRDDASDVVISTHSSITLTSVFDTEITLLRRSPGDGTVAVVRPPISTFGASPGDIMRHVFDAPESVEQRAVEFLDMALLVAASPHYVETLWSIDDGPTAWPDHPAFRVLWDLVQMLPHQYEDEQRLIRTLAGMRDYAQEVTGKATVTAIDALEALQDRLGPGYYQFEFRRRLRALRQGTGDVSSN